MAVKQTSLYLEEEKLKRIKVVAAEQGIRVNAVILEAIDKYLEENEQKN